MQETTLFGGLRGDRVGRRLGQLVDGFIATQVVAVTARLGVYDHLTEGAQMRVFSLDTLFFTLLISA